MRLGERLIASGVLTDAQVADGLRLQVVQGGRLGSCLIELGYIEINALGEALSQHVQLPAAKQKHFDKLDNAVIDRLSPELAAELRVIPVGLLADGGGVMIASMDELSEVDLGRLAEAMGAQPVVAVAPELRILYYLERFYGIPRENRFKRKPRTQADTNRSESEGALKRNYVKTLADDDAIDISFDDDDQALARVAIRRVAVRRRLTETPDIASLDDGLRAIRRSNGRDALGARVIQTLEGGYAGPIGLAVLFIIREGVAICWRGFGEGVSEAKLENLALPIERESAVMVSVAQRAPYFCGAGDCTDLDRQMWRYLGCAEPAEIAAIPIELRGELVCVLYAHSTAEMDASTAGGLTEIGQSFASGLDRLLRGAER